MIGIGINKIGRLGTMGIVSILSKNFSGQYYFIFINLLQINPKSSVDLSGYKIEIIFENEVIHSDITDKKGSLDFKNQNTITEYKVKISKTLPSGYFESIFDIEREKLGDKLDFYVDDDGKVYQKYVKVEKPILFLFNDDVAVDYNEVYSNSYWICYVNDTTTKKVKM